ncbi:MAG: outer membrane beta-barrel protein, partial [Pseudomonadota bacterium]
MKTSSVLTVLLLASLFASASATADQNYLVPSVVYTDDDKDRLVDDDFGGLELALGNQLTDRFALEGRLGIHQLDGVDDLDMVELGLTGLLNLADDRAVTPYALAGLSVLRTRSVVFNDRLTPAVSAGAGLKLRV